MARDAVRDDIAVGDRVYIWRTQGTQKAVAGAVAEAMITATAGMRPENAEAVAFWRSGTGERTALLSRALLRLVRRATSREVIRREWCMEDPVLRDLPNLKMAAATNYPVSLEQAERLTALWSRTGHD